MFNRMPFDLRLAAKFTNGFENSMQIRVRNAKGSDPAELLIYDSIGESWDGTGIAAKDVAGFLADNRGRPIDMKINSGGGAVFDGLAIYNGLISHNATVTATITGIAASIASVIAMAATRVKAYPSSSLMVHRAIAGCVGNTSDMADCGVWLDSIDGQLSQIYSGKTGRPVAEMKNYMIGKVDGTLFTAQQALDAKLIDEIIRTDNGGPRAASPRRPGGVQDRLNGVQADTIVHEARQSAARRQRELAHV